MAPEQKRSGEEDHTGKIHVRLKPGTAMVIQGERKEGGDDIWVTEDQARSGAQFFDAVDDSGNVGPLQIAGQPGGDVPAANLAGLPRHERIGSLEAEEKALAGRLERVRKQLEHERAGMQDDIKRQQEGARRGQGDDVRLDHGAAREATGGVTVAAAQPATEDEV